ncbi:HlyD family secretion protein [Vibrio sagamiensis]|uniref:Multidrug resistance protein MdtA-like barrel-sandwich hybrid domain-containing protein n=1 Tax=Vibrio sagamiensis NBRC 104589 TaxID=1219064 RepID=A0A511QHE6_9VIBR|nr:HlyD family efflux transporter periplasmic adaptor subunit [Vibrio sagamiensis]PNQ54726.1 hypothetical protein C1141_14890 [Vibrio agarivorans]GEM76734.1 hypothetical protein VSA01S_28460 [Vibrio sagamiensis NBRC 104589]
MSEERPIFRPEALEFKNNAWLGKFSVSVPSVLPISLYCAAAVFVILVMLLFSSYTQRISVSGYVTYFPSAVEGSFDQHGRVNSVNVTQGSEVQKGDTIATVSSDTVYSQGSVNQALVTSKRSQLSQLDLRERQRLNEGETERLHLKSKIKVKKNEMVLIKAAKKDEYDRSVILQKRVRDFVNSSARNLTTAQEKISYENDYYTSIGKLNSYRIDIAKVESELIELQEALSSSESREKKDITDIRQKKAQLYQEIVASLALVESQIVAPISGVISSLTVKEGQQVKPGDVAAVVLPLETETLIEISLPPSALSRVKVGQRVLMRIESKPWEWFGKVQGKVVQKSLSPSSLSTEHRNFNILIKPIDTSLDFPVGVKVEADILTNRRSIWEWLLTPMKHSFNRINSESM